MNNSILPLTKLVLALSAVTQTVFGLVMMFVPGLVNNVFWSSPFEAVPAISLRYQGVLYLAMALGAAYALIQDDRMAARTYLVIAGPYVVLCVLLAIIAAVTPPGVPPIMWLYVGLSALYLPLAAYVWRQESVRAR